MHTSFTAYLLLGFCILPPLCSLWWRHRQARLTVWPRNNGRTTEDLCARKRVSRFWWPYPWARKARSSPVWLYGDSFLHTVLHCCPTVTCFHKKSTKLFTDALCEAHYSHVYTLVSWDHSHVMLLLRGADVCLFTVALEIAKAHNQDFQVVGSCPSECVCATIFACNIH